jgi:ribosomal protein S1
MTTQTKKTTSVTEKIKSEKPAVTLKEKSPKTTKSVSGPEPSSMEELLSQTGYTMKSFKRGEVVEGTVLSISSRQVLLDIGGKGEGIVHEKEIPYISDILGALKVGDKLTAQIVNDENERGQVVVSLRRTASNKRWEVLKKALDDKAEVEVIIRELGRGGFLVDYQGLRGFIPMSQSDQELVRNGDKAAGRKVKVTVIEVDKDANRLVFSQRQSGLSEKQRELLKLIEVGKTYPAEVTGIVNFGAFASVKIAGSDSLPGLIHISEIAWEKVESPADYYKIGQKLDVKVIGSDPKSGKLTLSVKQLLADPWQDVAKVLTVDQTMHGKVTRITNYGVFVSLLPGIEGLIHISKISPGDEPKVGAEIECLIEEINPDRRKISLSMMSSAKPIGYR